jgi:hypothetical protein
VRHPKATKVWLTPQRYAFDTAFEVISTELRERDAHVGLLVDFDKRLQPIYHTEDALLDLGALVVSQQRASKNDLKRHFIELKKAQGFEVIEHQSDPEQIKEGEDLLAAARLLGEERLIRDLTGAETLTRTRFEEVRDRLAAREHVSSGDRWSFQKTRIELFYRQKIDEELVCTDDRGHFRRRVLNYEHFQRSQEYRIFEKSGFWKTMNKPTQFKMQLLPSDAELISLLIRLFELAPIYDGRVLLTERTFTSDDLTDFASEAFRLKAIVENVTRIHARSDVKKKPMMLLDSLLALLGLSTIEVDCHVENKKKRYFYTLDPQSLAAMDALAAKRKQLKAWDTLRQIYNMPAEDREFDDDLYSDRKDEEAA